VTNCQLNEESAWGGVDVFNTQTYPITRSRVDATYPTQTAALPLMLFLPFSYPGDGAGAKGTEFLTSDAIGASESILRAWLDWLGLRFNPFQSLDAAADTRLGEYLVEHEVLASIWGDWNSFVFAPAGGGKTALRVRTSQACWVGQATNHPFPISYLPPFLLWLHTHPSLDEHLAAISQAGAIRLLLALPIARIGSLLSILRRAARCVNPWIGICLERWTIG